MRHRATGAPAHLRTRAPRMHDRAAQSQRTRLALSALAWPPQVHGASTQQLKAAFVHLSSLAQQRAAFLAAATEDLMREDQHALADARDRSLEARGEGRSRVARRTLRHG